MLIRCMVRSHPSTSHCLITASSLPHHCVITASHHCLVASLPCMVRCMHHYTMHGTMHGTITPSHTLTLGTMHGTSHPSTSRCLITASSLPRITASSHHCHAWYDACITIRCMVQCMVRSHPRTLSLSPLPSCLSTMPSYHAPP